jgi:energy-coupling factor transport system permease protein
MLDPRTKLLLAIAYTAFLIKANSLVWLTAGLANLAGLVLILGLGGAWLRHLRLILVMTAIVVVISWLSFDLTVAILAGLRLMTIVSTFFLFFQTTLPEDLGNALVKMGVPYAFAFILTSSMQFVPVISKKVRNIIDAQRSRGIRLERDVISLQNYPALLAPLLIQSFKLSDELAEAMEARGFSRPGRTFLSDYRLQALDWLVLAGVVVTLLVIIMI